MATTQPAALEHLLFGYAPAQVLSVAARLGIADALADRAADTGELARRLGAHERSLFRLLRALAGLQVIAEVEPGRFALTESGQRLRSDAPGSLHWLALLFGSDETWQCWGNLLHTVKTGETAFDHLFGMGVFDYYGRDIERVATFNRAMSASTWYAIPGIVGGYDFSRLNSIVDVGGGDGTLLAALLVANSNLRGTVFDSAVGVFGAAKTLADAGVGDRSDVVAGDFFDGVPAGADAYLLKSILHDWDDERAIRILRACRRAMSPASVLLIVENVMAEQVGPGDLGAVFGDLNMMVRAGGAERTEREFRALLQSADLVMRSVSGGLGRTIHRILEAAPA